MADRPVSTARAAVHPGVGTAVEINKVLRNTYMLLGMTLAFSAVVRNEPALGPGIHHDHAVALVDVAALNGDRSNAFPFKGAFDDIRKQSGAEHSPVGDAHAHSAGCHHGIETAACRNHRMRGLHFATGRGQRIDLVKQVDDHPG